MEPGEREQTNICMMKQEMEERVAGCDMKVMRQES